MRGRDGRPHAQRTGESFYTAKPSPTKRPKRDKKLQEIEDFYRNQMRKQELQAENAQSKLFSKFVFYILGYCGRGKDSRFNMVKEIERNGGRTVLFMNGQVTHVITRGVCHRKMEMLEAPFESRKLVIVSPEWITDCVKKQKVLSVEKYRSVTWKKNGIENYCLREDEVVDSN
jgi:hypothetical protein